MNKSLIRGLVVVMTGLALAAGSTSCTKDLDQKPKYDLTPDNVYVDINGYKQVLAKLYGGFALTGRQGPAGDGTGDIGGIDEGTSDYIRQYWSAQELSTDEAVTNWTDTGIRDWHNMNWNSNNTLIQGLYSRIYYEIAICNEFIRESSDDKLASRLSGDAIATAKQFRAEARFLRAVSYMHALDLYGNGPFVTENDPVGFFQPPYATRQQLFTYVEQELTALSDDANFTAAHSSEYARVDKAAAWAMLARLYLNAQVYTGTARFNDAAAQAKKVIDAGYALNTAPAPGVSSAYGRLFLADNDVSPARNELIWSVAMDANKTQSYGGTTFLVNGSTGPNPAWQTYAGQTTNWAGFRTTKNLFNLFADTALDTRGRFWVKKVDNKLRTVDIDDQYNFEDGLGVLKYRNVNSAGVGQGGSQNFSSVDFPMIRLAEVMLTYAEAVTRGGTGDATLALNYVNQIRRRAYGLPINTPSAVADVSSLSTDFLLNERGRELFWEGYRRTDLIRFGRFVEGTPAALWPWKGGASGGRGVEAFRTIYPIPSSDLSVNQNLKQNPGY